MEKWGVRQGPRAEEVLSAAGSPAPVRWEPASFWVTSHLCRADQQWPQTQWRHSPERHFAPRDRACGRSRPTPLCPSPEWQEVPAGRPRVSSPSGHTVTARQPPVPQPRWLRCTRGLGVTSRNILEFCGVFIAEFPPHPTAATLAPLSPHACPGGWRTGDSSDRLHCSGPRWEGSGGKRPWACVLGGGPHRAPCPPGPRESASSWVSPSQSREGRATCPAGALCSLT